jgi:SAM-dependent methyltransferase
MTDHGVKMHTRLCPICDNANLATPPSPYSRPPWIIIDCAGCGFTHMRDVPDTQELVENLAWEKTYAVEAERRRKETPFQAWMDEHMRWRLNMFPRTEPVDIVNRIAPSGPAIDLGCGSGEHLARLDPRFTPYGVEISSHLAARATTVVAARGGKIIQDGSKDGLETFADASLAAATLRSYLEHDSDAGPVLGALSRKLMPGGVAVVKVPNYGSINRKVMGGGWCGIRLPDHVNYFTRSSLTALAQRHGLAVRFPFFLSLPTDDNMVAILHRR